MSVRVRFAPSPTGYLHIGNVHTALFNWLFARQQGGTMVLRLEDTDVERSSSRYEEAICQELAWLGLDWDEGIGKGGPYGPYRQSERTPLYRQYAEQLLASGHAYWCYCSPEELERERQEAAARGEAPRYSGRCLHLSAAEREALAAAGRRPALRFHVSPGPALAFRDLIHGETRIARETLGDFVILRPNGLPTYNFAVTVDDATMAITHVIRADEHLANTPRQLLLYEALGLDAPQFAHVAMLLGPDRTKLSKRHGATALGEYREQGYLPAAILNYLALLGWSPTGGEEILPLTEIIRQFDLARVGKSAAVFDRQKLNWVNSQYLRALSLKELTEKAVPFLVAAGYLEEEEARRKRLWLAEVLATVRESLNCLAEVVPATTLFFRAPVYTDPEVGKLLSREETERILTHFVARLAPYLNAGNAGKGEKLTFEAAETLLHALPEELHLGRGKTLRPLRAALTGKLSGPELNRVVALLGAEECQRRAQAALAWRERK